MKTKIAVDLPTKEKLLAGLAVREVHPPLVRAEQAVADAERDLERRRRDLADHERRVAELPARVGRGEVRASALTEALRDRDAAALLIPPAENALAKARERLPIEERAAKLAVEKETNRRIEQLEKLAAELTPVLDELGELAVALGAHTLEWPDSPISNARGRVAVRMGGAT